jgi:PKD repeat protein
VEPTLENGGVFDSPDYRTAYMSFGLEGVNETNSTVTQVQLVEKLYEWLMDEVTVEVKEGAGGPLNSVIAIEAEATSSVDADFVQFRWDFGDGTPKGTTSDGTVYHMYTSPGTYTVTVEATDAYGHKALATGEVVVNGGVDGMSYNDVTANDMPMAGDEIEQTIVMHSTVMTPTTGLMVNALPAHTEYITHTGGTWVGSTSADIVPPGGGTLTLQNSLYLTNTFTSAGEAVTMTLTYRVMPGTSADVDIVNTSQFWVGDDNDYFERETMIDLWGSVYLPLALRQ